jgi:hypothetical protein
MQHDLDQSSPGAALDAVRQPLNAAEIKTASSTAGIASNKATLMVSAMPAKTTPISTNTPKSAVAIKGMTNHARQPV